jgi:hypothetical protein
MRTFEDVTNECRDINKQIAVLFLEHRNQRGNVAEQTKITESISSLQKELSIIQTEIRDNFM